MSRRLKSFLYPILLALFLWAFSSQGLAEDELFLLVPLFVYPSWWESSFSWQQVADAGKRTKVYAVINQMNGPLPQPTADFSKAMSILNDAGVYQFGYVNTTFAKKSLNESKAEIDIWFSQNPQIMGIYFDQISTLKENRNYYTELFNYVKNKRFSNQVILNVGSAAPIDMYNSADLIVLFNGEEKSFRSTPIANNIKDLDPQRKAAIVMSCSLARLPGVIEYAKSNNVKFVYVSNERAGNFTKLTGYWSSLMKSVTGQDE